MSATAETSVCLCQNCSGKIEFETEHAGETTACPHCGLETRLYVLDQTRKPAAARGLRKFIAASFKRSPPKPKPAPSKPGAELLTFSAVIIFLVGMGLILQGCASEATESSALRQTVEVIQYCAGFVLVALSFTIRALARLIEK